MLFTTKIYLCRTINSKNMFHQFAGEGANIFIAIVAVLVGFATALGYVDFLRTKKEEKKDH